MARVPGTSFPGCGQPLKRRITAFARVTHGLTTPHQYNTARHDRIMHHSSFARPDFAREAAVSFNIPGRWTWPVTALPRGRPRSQAPARRLLAAWSERGILRGVDWYSTT